MTHVLKYTGTAQTSGSSQSSLSVSGGGGGALGGAPSTHLPDNLTRPNGIVNENFALTIAAANVPALCPPFRAPGTMTVRVRAGSNNGGIVRLSENREELTNGGGASLGAGEEDIFPVANGGRLWYVGDTAKDTAVISVRSA